MSEILTMALTLCGRRFFIRRGGEFRLLTHTGLEAAPFEVTLAENGASDGGFAAGARFGARIITLELEPCGDAECARASLIAVLTPKNTGELLVTRGDAVRRIAFVLSSAVFVQPTIFTPPRIRLTLLCPDPFFSDPGDTTVTFRKTAPLFTFPLNLLSGCGISSGIWRVSDTAVIVNSGDADIGIVCTIKAAGGSVENPAVTLDGGGYVKLLTLLSDGDKAVICTRRGVKSVEVNGKSRFIFDRRSVFFQLPPGKNTVTISADAGLSYANASFSYSLRYNGI